ncbi:response regulator transcription factor [Spirosoma validum]|uniref:Response regulator transcription factor n=1 Tax=Spirosoma validum TaxID=2771355 RepID=A0A927AXK6_9BACT|nr:response regulator transcription factor [Spirosoma validum]MBD2751655.1 response regulator transcription factor [Spirosoma validum]
MRILIVEDESKLAVPLQRSLKENGFKVFVTLNSTTAREDVESGDFHLVILDVNRPDSSGYELCRDIRTQNNQIPIIVLTPLGTIDNKLMCFDAGADDCVVKPFEFSELLARIQAHLKRNYPSYDPELSKPHQLTMADLTLDLRRKTVSRAGNKEIHVTPREFTLLEYFLRNKGTVLSREEIEQYVWETPISTGVNLLNVYINSLRRKIDKGFDTKLIHTRKGFGFQMKVSGE